MSEARALAVVIHDVAPATRAACERLIDAVHAVAPVPLTLLVVPAWRGAGSWHDTGFTAWLDARAAAGDELALHGYTHVDGARVRGPLDWLRRRVYTREAEFATLRPASAAARIDAGLRWFAREGWAARGFVAPAWLLGAGAWHALRRPSPLTYTTTLNHVHLLDGSGRALVAPSLVYSSRSALRRAASRAWVPQVARAAATGPLLRLALHPADAAWPAITRSWQRLLAAALADRTGVTKGGWVEGQRARHAACPEDGSGVSATPSRLQPQGAFR